MAARRVLAQEEEVACCEADLSCRCPHFARCELPHWTYDAVRSKLRRLRDTLHVISLPAGDFDEWCVSVTPTGRSVCIVFELLVASPCVRWKRPLLEQSCNTHHHRGHRRPGGTRMILSLLCAEAGALAEPTQAANDTTTQAAPTRRHRQRTQRSNDTALFTFAVMSDTHVWLPSAARDEYQRSSDNASERDGLLVEHTDSLLRHLMRQLSVFAATGGSFAIHSGDAVCGGGSFTMAGEYESSLEAVVAEQRAALGSWPVFYASGNHDIDPTEGGLAKWRRLLGGSGMGDAASASAVGYRAVRVAPGWRLLLLDAMDGVPHDADGHGHVGEVQLAWLSRELDESAAKSQQIILVVHQLLVAPLPDRRAPYPPSSSTELPAAWLDWRADFVDNREELLALLARHSHVRVCFHGHVHANTEVRRHGITFVSSAAVGEYPMTWREVAIYPCEMVISIRTASAPLDLLEKSRWRDTRAGRNEIKASGPTVTKVPLQCASAEHVLAAAAAGGRTVPVPLAPLPPPSSPRSPPPLPPLTPPHSLPPSPPPSPLGVQSSQRQKRTAATRAARYRHRT